MCKFCVNYKSKRFIELRRKIYVQNKVIIQTNLERDISLRLFSDQKFFFPNFTPFTIVNEESENVFYVYGEFYSMFSAFDVEGRVRKYISTDIITYILIIQPGLIPHSYDNLIDRGFKGVSPKGNGKIVITTHSGSIEINIDYAGDREKQIVNFIVKTINKQTKNLDKIISLERIKRHI